MSVVVAWEGGTTRENGGWRGWVGIVMGGWVEGEGEGVGSSVERLGDEGMVRSAMLGFVASAGW